MTVETSASFWVPRDGIIALTKGNQNSTILGKLRKALATVKWVAAYPILDQYVSLELSVLLFNNIYIIRRVHDTLTFVPCIS